MASFDTPSAAVGAAIAMQRDITDRNALAQTPIDLRIGISAGEPLSDDGDLFGATVQLAARLCAACAPGGITTSVAVRELCIGKQIAFDDRGAITLKGLPDTQCFEIRWS
jgi:adenylate cyclase